jgi:hypothetical protein
MNSLLPSQNFLEKATRISGMGRLIERIIKEMEVVVFSSAFPFFSSSLSPNCDQIYSYFAEKIPRKMDDSEWDRYCSEIHPLPTWVLFSSV